MLGCSRNIRLPAAKSGEHLPVAVAILFYLENALTTPQGTRPTPNKFFGVRNDQ
jgi:hypothetical protein